MIGKFTWQTDDSSGNRRHDGMHHPAAGYWSPAAVAPRRELCRPDCRDITKTAWSFLIFMKTTPMNMRWTFIRYPKLDLIVLIRFCKGWEAGHCSIFRKYRPEIIFHAAAHKHVPLMETSPGEAVKNNIIGTFHIASASDKYHASKMILISTDKAVRPTNVMGASKRICEMIIQEFSQKSRTDYAAVRFGNVMAATAVSFPCLKSKLPMAVLSPSHTPIWRVILWRFRKLWALVLQAAAFAKGGEIFILDMGEPVHILELAKKMIVLPGLIPGQDIPIVFTGLRPVKSFMRNWSLIKDIWTGHPMTKFLSANRNPLISSSWSQKWNYFTMLQRRRAVTWNGCWKNCCRNIIYRKKKIPRFL